jgi:glutathione S-transferase
MAFPCGAFPFRQQSDANAHDIQTPPCRHLRPVPNPILEIPMRLYYKPGACSLAVHVALRELDLACDLERVDTDAQKTETGADYSRINPNGHVPALALDDGEVLTEGPAILQYLADAHPAATLAPPAGTLARARLQQWLNFTSAELHKAFSPFFAAEPPAGAAREAAEARLRRRLGYPESALADGRPYLLGDGYSVADIHAFAIVRWADPVGLGLNRWPHLKAFAARIAARPRVAAAMRAEGLI